VHLGHDRLLQLTEEAGHVLLDLHPRDAVLVRVTRARGLVEVRSGAEGATGAAQHEDARLAVRGARAQGLGEVPQQPVVHGVEHARPVQGQVAEGVAALVEDGVTHRRWSGRRHAEPR
jgi:hypothetical protein